MSLTVRARLLGAWGSLHVGEVIRRQALRCVLRHLVTNGETPLHVLDAGCGRGDNALWIARQYPGVTVHAIDIDPNLVAAVRRRVTDAGLQNVSVEQADIENLSLVTHSPLPRCGIVWSVDVLEHVRDPARAVEQLATVLAMGGHLVVHVPRAKQRRWFRRFEHYEQHDHERDGFEPEELTMLVRTAGLEIEEIRHTFGPPGALAWELFHLAQGIGKWAALLTYPIPWTLAWVDGLFRWKRGNGVLMIAKTPPSSRRRM